MKSIKNEYDFIVAVCQNEKKDGCDIYPRVSSIPIVSRQDFSELGVNNTGALFANLIKNGYINKVGLIQPKFKKISDYSGLTLDPIYDSKKEGIYAILKECSENEKIKPDIDLLRLDKKNNLPRINCYEIKFIRKDRPHYSFYTGLGEALCYFEHGAQRVELWLGCFNMSDGEITKVENKFREHCNFLKDTLLSKFPFIDIKICRPHTNQPFFKPDDLLPGRKDTDQRACFSTRRIRNKKIRYSINKKKRALLKGRFVYAEKWLKKRTEVTKKL